MTWSVYLARHGGIATTAEFYRDGWTQSILYWSVAYGSLIRIREGLYCGPNLAQQAVRALRVGGRLACVSALAFHGLAPEPLAEHGDPLESAAGGRRPRLGVGGGGAPAGREVPRARTR